MAITINNSDKSSLFTAETRRRFSRMPTACLLTDLRATYRTCLNMSGEGLEVGGWGYLYADVQVKLNKFELIWTERGGNVWWDDKALYGNQHPPVNRQTDRCN